MESTPYQNMIMCKLNFVNRHDILFFIWFEFVFMIVCELKPKQNFFILTSAAFLDSNVYILELCCFLKT